MIRYLLVNQQRLAWATLIALGAVARLGLIMAALDPRLPHRRQSGKGVIRTAAVPPERNFPLSVVITHGVLAVITVVLVLFTAFGAGVI